MDPSRAPLDSKAVKEQVAQADRLAANGEYTRARDIYESLIRGIHARMREAASQGKTIGPGTRNTLKILEKRLQDVQSRITRSEQERPTLDLRSFRMRLRNAELYASRDLLAEAREIVQSLVEHVKAWQEGSAPAPEAVQASEKSLDVLRKRLMDLRVKEEYLEKKGAHPAPTPEQTALEDDQAVFWLAVAAGGSGLSAEKVQVFDQAPDRVSDIRPYQALADFLVENGELRQGKELYRKILDSGDLDPSSRIPLLEKLAGVNESMGISRAAIRNYRSILKLDKNHPEAQERLDVLRRDIRRIRLSIATVTDHPWFFFGLSLLIALFFLAFAPFTKTINNVDYFTLEDDPEIAYYEEFKEIFGNDEFFVIAFEKDDIFTEENLTLLLELTEDLEFMEEAKEVNSLANVDDVIGEQDFFEVREFLRDIPSDPEVLRELREQALGNPLYVDSLISKDGRTASIVVEAFDRPDDEDYRLRLMEETQEILGRYRDRADGFHIAGWTYTNLSLSQYMKQDVARFIPITYLFITLAIWLVFRNVILTALAIANISVCVGSVMGLMGLTGITLNNVTSIIPSMVMALALCDTVHIFSHMDRRMLSEAGGDRRKALAGVLQRVVLPSFLTSVTTAVGFLSQGISRIPPIRDFAWIASAGMGFEFLYSFFFLPPLLLLFKPEKLYQSYDASRGMTLVLNRLFELVKSHYKAIAVCITALILAGGWYATQIRVETNTIGYFKKQSPLRQAMDFVESRLGGVDSMDISVSAREVDAFKDPKNLEILDKIQQYLETLPGIDGTVSFTDFIKDMNESFHNEDPEYYKIPESRAMVSQYLLLYGSDDIENVINSTYDHARIGVQLSVHSSSDQAKLIEKIRPYLTEHFPVDDLEFKVTGRALKDVITINALVEGQLYSLALAVLVITLIMFMALKSVSMGLLSVIPNSFPIVLNFGIMGALGIPLDTGTAIIAAVAIGIAVDDTMHFLSEYKSVRDTNMPVHRAIRAVLLIKGRALISSSLILCIGFSVLILSHFVPTMNFGLLTAIIMITAMAGDMVFLPSLMMFKAKIPGKGARP